MKSREKQHRHYWKDIEASRKYHRDWTAGDRERHLDAYRNRERRQAVLHREERRLRSAIYYEDHREDLLLTKRETWQANREDINQRRRERARKSPAFGLRSAHARAFEDEVIKLRSEGWTWKEIGELTGHPWKSCQSSYYRSMKQRQSEQDESQ